MKKYKVWASQTLWDEHEIEAESLQEAEAIANKMYQETGELDPRDIIDGECGAKEIILDSEYSYGHRIDVPRANP